MTAFGKVGATTVSSADLVRNFGQYRRTSDSGPVFVTHHSRATHVLLSIEGYEALSEFRARLAESDVEHLIDESIANLSEWSSDALIVCDHDLNIKHLNHVAEALSSHSRSECIGLPLATVLPSIESSLLDVQVKRTQRANEPTAADIPSPFTPGTWLHLRTYPWRERIMIRFRDITDEVQHHRLADVKGALIEAMSAHESIGYVRLSVRGTIDRVEGALADLVGISSDRLVGVPFSNLIEIAERAAFRESLEHVFRDGTTFRQVACLMRAGGETVEVEMSVAALRSGFGTEGAALLLSVR